MKSLDLVNKNIIAMVMKNSFLFVVVAVEMIVMMIRWSMHGDH